MTPKPHFEFSFASGFEEDTFTGIAEDLRAGGAEVVKKRRPPEGPYAFLELLIPTAVILLIAYLKSFSEETGKLHAQALLEALPKLWGKVFGPKPEITYTIIGPRGNV